MKSQAKKDTQIVCETKKASVMIISHTPVPLYDDHGIRTMIIYDFLLNPDSLEI